MNAERGTQLISWFDSFGKFYPSPFHSLSSHYWPFSPMNVCCLLYSLAFHCVYLTMLVIHVHLLFTCPMFCLYFKFPITALFHVVWLLDSPSYWANIPDSRSSVHRHIAVISCCRKVKPPWPETNKCWAFQERRKRDAWRHSEYF